MATPEKVILVIDNEGDVVSVVRPVDPLNVEHSAEAIEERGFDTQTIFVTSLGDWIEYDDEMGGGRDA